MRRITNAFEWACDHPERVIPILLGAILLCFVFIMWQRTAKGRVLMDECLADGNKRYQCVAMLRRNSGPILVVPR